MNNIANVFMMFSLLNNDVGSIRVLANLFYLGKSAFLLFLLLPF